MAINGRTYDWEDVTITLPFGTLIDVEEITYEDEKEIEPIYGKGGMPRAYGRGDYQARGTLKVQRPEFLQMIVVAGTYEIPPVPINVHYAEDDQPPQNDILKDCKFVKRSFAAAQGDTKMVVDLEFNILGGIFANLIPPQNLL